MQKKENKVNKKQNDSTTKNIKEPHQIKIDLKNKNKNKTEPNIDIQYIQSLQNEILNLRQLIEEKDKEIEFLKEDNKNNYNLILLEKQNESLNYENKLEKINKKKQLIKVRNELLTQKLNEKEQQIKTLNKALLEYKQNDSSKEQIKDKNNDENKEKDNNENNEKYKNYEIELNKIKNNLNESEVKNTK